MEEILDQFAPPVKVRSLKPACKGRGSERTRFFPNPEWEKAPYRIIMCELTPRQVYLAGPMRKIARFNFPAFARATKKLRRQGFSVFSPAEHDIERGWDPQTELKAPGGPPGHSLSEYMEHDLAAVCRADLLCVLPGWTRSEGARLEVYVARYLKKPVLRWDTLEPVVLGFDK